METGVAPEPGPGLLKASQMAGQRLMGTDVPPERSRAMEVARPSAVGPLAVAGAVGGFKAGAAGMGTPLAPIVNPITGSLIGGMAGAGLGAVAPEAGLWMGTKLGLIPQEVADAHSRSKEELRRMALGEMALDLHFGVFGTGMTGLASRMLIWRPLARATTRPHRSPVTGEKIRGEAVSGKPMTGEDLAKEAHERLGITLMPWQVGKSPMARGILAVAGRFPWVGAPARTSVFGTRLRGVSGQLRSEKEAITRAEAIPAKIGEVKTDPELSAVILSDTEHLYNRFQSHYKQRYQQVWDLAEQAGVRVKLSHTHSKANELLRTMDRVQPSKVGGGQMIGEMRGRLKSFIENEIVPLEEVQSLKQLDTLVEEIDDFYKQLEPKQQASVQSQINELRNAALTDFEQSTIELPRWGTAAEAGLPTTTTRDPSTLFPSERMGMGGPAGPGPTMETMQTGPGQFEAVNAKGIANMVREIDAEYSNYLSFLFETSIAKKFGRVMHRGIRGHTWDPVTATPLGKLANFVLDTEDSKAISELFRLVDPRTRKDITASVLERGLAESWKEAPGVLGPGGMKFDTEAFSKYFGLTPTTKARHDALDQMLKEAGSPVSSDDIRLLGRAMESIAISALPSASTFIARRAQMGGLKSLTTGLLGGAAIGGATGDPGFAIKGAAIGSAFMFLGVRGFIRAISNPAGAKAFKDAIKEEGSLAMTRANWMRLVRSGTEAMIADVKEYIPNATEKDLEGIRKFSQEFQDAMDLEFRAVEAEEKQRRIDRAVNPQRRP